MQNQSNADWEMILVEDGKKIDFPRENDGRLVFLEQPHFERVIAMNKAMENTKGEWFVFVNSDDELFSYSLDLMEQMIKKNPEAKMFNCGSYHVSENWGSQTRGVFEPKKEKVGHEPFGPGNIVDGTFFFHRSIYEDLGAFPPMLIDGIDCSEINYGGVRKLFMVNPWDFSAAFQLEFPEQRKFFMVDKGNEPKKRIRELGNPWGNDHYLFYKFTRKYHSTPYQIPIIIIHHEGRQGDGHSL